MRFVIPKIVLAGVLAYTLLAPPEMLVTISAQKQAEQKPGALRLPMADKSVRFAIIGDNGTGEKPQYDVGNQMWNYRQLFRYEFVLMLGDNIYGRHDPKDMKRKFEDPYRNLLDAGVKFYASLGNHDSSNQRFYKYFNMNGKRYYSFKVENAQFFALDSNYMDPEQLTWLDRELASSNADWKIAFFHHPLYTNARFHGPNTDLRKQIEPLFQRFGVNVVFAGHEHVYERLKPQNGIYYWVLGNSGQLRYQNLRPSPETAKGIDTVQTFAVFELTKDEIFFQAISRTGETVDSGSFRKQEKVDVKKPASALTNQ